MRLREEAVQWRLNLVLSYPASRRRQREKEEDGDNGDDAVIVVDRNRHGDLRTPQKAFWTTLQQSR